MEKADSSPMRDSCYVFFNGGGVVGGENGGRGVEGRAGVCVCGVCVCMGGGGGSGEVT